MKKSLVLLFLVFNSLASLASHIYGGEMIYEYLATNSNGTKKYRITLRLFRDNSGGAMAAQLPNTVLIGIYNYEDQKHYPATQTSHSVIRSNGPNPVPVNVSPCITGSFIADYSVASYSLEIDLPTNKEGYICSFETCCRVNNLANVFHAGGLGGTGSTYVCRIPGTDQLEASKNNSSPQFVTSLDLVCYDRPFKWNFGATDPDKGDSLVYSFAPAYDKVLAQNANETNQPVPPYSTPPDYPLVTYINGYSSSSPLGGRATIDPKTGLISGIAPPLGQYVVAVLIREFRDGKQISEHRKDFILRVQDCEVAAAQLNPNYPICDQFGFTFKNEAPPSPLIKSYYWEFSYKGKIIGTSTLPTPHFNFPDTGRYDVKMVVNRGDQCSDSTQSIALVYPGFNPDFNFSGVCVQNPTQFTDATSTRYGVVDKWSWDFGESTTSNDVSDEQNPSYQYPQTGQKSIRLIVGSSKGCIDTAIKQIELFNKPPLQVLTKDTLMCKGDTTQLGAFGNGNFTWTPNSNIRGQNTGSPEVWPVTTTTYYVELNDQGCINTDSIRVRVVNFVTLQAMNDTTICLTDSVQLNANTNGLRLLWTPSNEIDNPTIVNPKARPVASTTTYTITARIGRCVDSDDVIVKTIPYPEVNAGSDVTICYETQTQLNGTTNGAQFSWTPTIALSNPAILNPIASPLVPTEYILTAQSPASGCPKPSRDTVLVYVMPEIHAFAGRDTAVVVGQPLQFLATGGDTYVWSPATNLSSTAIPNPVGIYDGSFEYINYKVVARMGFCEDSAYVKVRVFKTPPQIFVPTGFTPNNDNHNDLIRPLAVGMVKMEYFRIFNRWGEMVFSTTISGHGWDGRIKGKEQGTGVYVWVVKGEDYLGKPFFAKGTVTLIR